MCGLLRSVGVGGSLFLHYDVVSSVYNKLFRWVGMPILLSHSILEIFEVLLSFGSGKKVPIRSSFDLAYSLNYLKNAEYTIIFCLKRRTINHCMNLIIGLTWKLVQTHASCSDFSLLYWE